MALGLKQSSTWRDAKGNTARTTFYVSNAGTPATQNTAAQAVVAAMIALTNAHLQANYGPDNSNPQPVVYGTNSLYASVEDKVIFTFQGTNGSIHRFQIPCPISGIFLPDGETVDNTVTAVTTYTSAVVANCVSRDGETIAFGAFGTRIRRKLHRRLNIFVLAPDLVGPAE